MQFKCDSDFFKDSFGSFDSEEAEVNDPAVATYEDEEEILSEEEYEKLLVEEILANEKDKKPFNIPIPTRLPVVQNRTLDLRLFCSLLLISNHFGTKSLQDEHRYLYDNKMQQHMNYLTLILGITSKTFMTNLRKLILDETGIIKTANYKKKLVYKLYSKNIEGKDYVLIDNKTLEKLVRNNKSIDIKVYCILKYMLRKDKESTITQEWIAERLGYSKNSRQMIARSLNRLEASGLIKVTSKLIKDRKWVDNHFKTNIFVNNFYEIV